RSSTLSNTSNPLSLLPDPLPPPPPNPTLPLRNWRSIAVSLEESFRKLYLPSSRIILNSIGCSSKGD
ncbi:hypothetical protein PENTCL1PPCAC_2434, partial [Pristionchus entomophagus]